MKSQYNENSSLTQNIKHDSTDEDAKTFVQGSPFEGAFLTSHNHFYNKEELTIINEPICTTKLAKRLLIDTVIAGGTGLAMMPIFNHLVRNSDKFGIDIHSNKTLFNLSTTNTFIVSAFSSFINTNEFIRKQDDNSNDNNSKIVNFSKLCASLSLILPVGLLWVTEVNNQKIANSKGFDEYIAWASFTTLPLIVSQIIDSITHVNKLALGEEQKVPLSSGGKIMIYGLAISSVIGRSIAYTEVCKSLGVASGLSEDVSLGLGIAAGGILTSAGMSILEHSTIKFLCETQDGNFTAKKFITGTLAFTEGLWFTLPLISIGLDATSNWNPLLKGALFVPLVISHTVLESTRVYDNVLTFCDYVSDGLSSLKDYCFGEDMQLSGNMYNDVDFITNE